MIRDENGLLGGYVYVDVAGRDIGSYVDEAKSVVRDKVERSRRLSAGLERPVRGHGARRERLKVVLPLTLFLIFLLLYLNTQVGGEDAASSCWPCRSRRSARSGCCTCSATT